MTQIQNVAYRKTLSLVQYMKSSLVHIELHLRILELWFSEIGAIYFVYFDTSLVKTTKGHFS